METCGFTTPTQVLLEPLREQEPGSRRVGGGAGAKGMREEPLGPARPPTPALESLALTRSLGPLGGQEAE